MKPILEALNWRYATDIFTSDPIPQNLLDTILEAARLAPSSMNFQPWKYIQVESSDIRNQIFDAGYQQESIKAPTLLILTVHNILNSHNVDAIIQITAQARNISPDTLGDYRNMLQGFVDKTHPEQFLDWSRRQAYISLGIFLTTAAQLEVDAAPMEGFDATKVSEILGLTDYTPVTIIGLGYRSPNDTHQNWPKVRFEMNNIWEKR